MSKNIPLSCKLKIHFPKMDGDGWVCMYCNAYSHPRMITRKFTDGSTLTYVPLKGF